MTNIPFESEKKPNRLITEKSPYLLQHAYNPVDWYPWGNDAFERAKSEDKPVFVSIGYSTCHWCHVMEKESFEDTQVAALMNRAFVSIKVDREERPDLDAAYMAVCQATGRSCGWPLNVIMTPNKNPFFVTSYIPKNDRYGTAGMLSLVPQIEQIWKTRRSEMESIGRELNSQIAARVESPSENQLSKDTLDNAYEQLFLLFDQENGGFGGAPKFPTPHNLLFLLRYYKRTGQKSAWDMVEKTLRAMRLGGIFDQAGLGFHRYCTDREWLVPHFEKMLYDQALLSLAYLEAYQASGALKFMVTAKETIDYVLRDLISSEGGFFSAEDADSEGEEGKFYLWTAEEIKQALPEADADFALELFGVKAQGNYTEAGKGKSGKNILNIAVPLEQLADQNNLTMNQLIVKLDRITTELLRVREKRVHPAKDDKILVDWNGLMIAALARANQVLGEKRYLQAATQAADFILKEMKTADGKLYHRYAKAEKATLAFLDDYACLVYGLIELYEACFDERYLQASVDLTKTMLAGFWDSKAGGFFFTDKAADESVPRMKQNYDGALPSGNSVALLNLLRLARLSGEATFDEYAQKTLRAFSEDVANQPLAHTFMLAGLDFALGPNFSVVLAGDSAEQDTAVMLAELRKAYMPNLTVRLWTAQSAKTAVLGVNYERLNAKATAYVCRNQTCMPPTTDPQKVKETLQA